MMRKAWMNRSFTISLILLVFVGALLVDVFYVHPDAYKDPLRTQIVTAILMLLSIVGGYWIRSSTSAGQPPQEPPVEKPSP